MFDRIDSCPYEQQPSQHDAADSSLDQPMDAIIYDVHPALLIRPEDLRSSPPLFSLQTEPAEYIVPQRFGMSALLGIMTVLALLFGTFHIMNAEPVVYLFFGLQTIVICLVQMFNGNTPRAASAVTGAILMPLFAPRLFNFDFPFDLWWRWAYTAGLIIFGVPFGAFLGYLTGTCAAGIFLVIDYLEPYLQGHAARPAI